MIAGSVVVKEEQKEAFAQGATHVPRRAIAKVDGDLAAGDQVVVIDSHGRVLGRGLWASKAAIAVHLFSRSGSTEIGPELWRKRLIAARDRRARFAFPNSSADAATTGFRLVNGAGDGLPAIHVDAYGDVLVLELESRALRRHRDDLMAAIHEVFQPRELLVARRVQSTPEARASKSGKPAPTEAAPTEGAPIEAAPTEGAPTPAAGDPPAVEAPSSPAVPEPKASSPEAPAVPVRFFEDGAAFVSSSKYLERSPFPFEQRALRRDLAQFCRDAVVLDTFCQLGGRSLSAATAGAQRVVAVDRDEDAIAQLRETATARGLTQVEARFGDVFTALRSKDAQGANDVVCVDLPPTSHSRRGKGGKNRRGKSETRRSALELACGAAKDGGIIVVSTGRRGGNVLRIRQTIAQAMNAANCNYSVVATWGAGADFPDTANGIGRAPVAIGLEVRRR